MRTLITIAVLLLPALCWASPSSARAKAIIAVLDADEDTYQPELPNDFDKQGSTALPDTGQVAPPQAPVVTFWGKPRCDACDNAQADCKGYTALDFHFEKDPAKWPEWVKQKYAAGEELPLIEWKSANPKGSYQAGWSGLAAFIKRYNASLKPAAAGATTMAPSSAGNSPVAAVYRPWLGNAAPGFSSMAQLREHVANDHRRGWRAVNRMSDAEVIQWHDRSHGWGNARASTGLDWSFSFCGRG